jgi:hypothetical protein
MQRLVAAYSTAQHIACGGLTPTLLSDGTKGTKMLKTSNLAPCPPLAICQVVLRLNLI